MDKQDLDRLLSSHEFKTEGFRDEIIEAINNDKNAKDCISGF